MSTTDVIGVDAGMIQAPTSTGDVSITTDTEPTLIQFIATNTNTKLNNIANSVTSDYGWCNGIVDLRNNISRSIFVGTGSRSTNGCALESSDQYPINILELNSDGNGINNRIQASISSTSSNGFTLSFNSVGNGEYILYKSYSLTEDAKIDVGFSNAPTSPTTQSIETGFNPSVVRMYGQPNLTKPTETIQHSDDWGLSHGILTPSEQYSLSFASYSNNVNNHVFGSRNDSPLLILHDDSKGGITGQTEASGEITDSGFDLSYNNVEGTGELILYWAVDISDDVIVKKINSPLEKGRQPIPTKLDNISVIANSSISSIFSTEFSGGNQNEITYGWIHGAATSSENQYSLSVGASSDSINAHRFGSSDTDVLLTLFTDANGNEHGTEKMSINKIISGYLGIEFSEVADASSNTLSSEYETYPILIWGIESSKVRQA